MTVAPDTGPVVTQAPAPTAPGIPPQLAFALGEGPLGGVRGQATFTNTVPDSATPGAGIGSLLAVVTTPLLGTTVNNSGGDESLVVDGLTAVVRTVPQLVPGTAGNLVVPDVSWVFTQPAALARVVLSGGVETLEGFDRWLASLPQASPPQAVSADNPAETAPGPVDEVVEVSVAAPSWTETLGYRPFWWSATAVLTAVWVALNGQKWLAARRGQKPELRDLVK